jgi:hypothetical protein
MQDIINKLHHCPTKEMFMELSEVALPELRSLGGDGFADWVGSYLVPRDKQGRRPWWHFNSTGILGLKPNNNSMESMHNALKESIPSKSRRYSLPEFIHDTLPRCLKERSGVYFGGVNVDSVQVSGESGLQLAALC